MKFSCLAAALLMTAAAFTSAAAEEARQDFDLVNKTGYEIKHVYVSPSKTDDWEEDVLGKDTLDDGDTWSIKFHRSTRTCMWDLKVVYAVDSSSAVWSDINLCKIEKVTIRYNKNTDKTTATFD